MLKEHVANCIALRHELHAHPELSLHETWTKARLMQFLQTYTSLEIHDEGPYFYAVYRGNRADAIAFRADFDALPIEDAINQPYRSQFEGVGHKCGHDGHSATLCGLALEVERLKPNRTVVFLFQPAEETGEGALLCQSVFEKENITEFYAYHNYPGEPFKTVSIRSHTMCLTSKGLSLYFEGKRSHASQPEAGINPSFAIAKMIQKIESISTRPSLFDGFVCCTIVHVAIGEEAFGISAGEGVLRVTIRSEFSNDLEKLQSILIDTAQELAHKDNVHFRFDEQDYFPVTTNDENCVQKVWKACQQINQPIKELIEPFRASEDFGYFVQKVPGAMIFMGDGENYPPLHTIEFDFPDELLEAMVHVFYQLIEISSNEDE